MVMTRTCQLKQLLKRRSLMLCVLILTFVPTLVSSVAKADDFDWRDVDGKNYLTSVKYQGPVASCWILAAMGTLEAKFDVWFDDPDLNLDLSEQHVIIDGRYGSSSGGFEYGAFAFFRDTGVVSEEELPYTASDTSPLWPLQPEWEDRVYKISGFEEFITSSNQNIKDYLHTYGPLLATMNTHYDWYWPSEPVGLAETPEELTGSFELSEPGQVGWVNHAVTLTGYHDDPAVAGGGYWIVKNTWGDWWGDDGYGYIRYGVLEGHNRIHAITGEAYLPEPGGLVLLLGGAWTVLLGRPKRGSAS